MDTSEMGPGKPYWRMPEGETRETVVVVGVVPEAGDGGVVLLGGVLGPGEVGVGLGACLGLEDEEKMAAVTAEPANAEAAAMRARVLLDILGGVCRS